MQWYKSVLIIHSLFHTFSDCAGANSNKIRALRLCSDFHMLSLLVLFSGDLLILLRGDYTLVTKLSDLFLRVQMQVEKSLNFLKHFYYSLSNNVSVISAVYITCASIRSC